MKINNRLCNIKEYHFKEIDDIKNKMIAQGKEIIDFGIGDPDISVHKDIIKGLVDSLQYNDFNKYPPYDGINELKKAIIKYYREIFQVYLDMDEVLVLIGSKEGISNIIPAVCDIGDYVIVPNPRYPVYEMCSYLWGCKPYKVPLKEKNNYLIDLSNIPDEIRKKSKLMIINYPNNPTGAIANNKFYNEVLNYCIQNDIVLCNDSAYNEIIRENKEPVSLLQTDLRKKSIEFGTFSKTFNMTGFRIGYAVGNRKVLKALLKVKSNLDSSQFKAIQYAAVSALNIGRDYIKHIRKIYDDRRNIAEEILKQKGIRFYKGDGTFYIWCKVPSSYTTDELCREFLSSYGIIVTPGYAFGDLGHGYFRIALTKDRDVIYKTLNRLRVYN
ncbi:MULTISPECIES: aminotransferase class I/II-fold pyridoxal phosphate-dependent enzyme [Clostridium]|uniref:LL-diaminopimelate aminotransferase n=2 Tax=Clostridium TaxID=1485 RepID=A0A151ARB4_9CLOT|nr:MULTISPECIES: aminotransferase class I/II-fold pyridoxal phosphate-dependent enzyme [Clostridium]KYH29947.1 LL-diaminopimelate aminotransferase [Clostridium colicanis DSM 13634]MBE6044150.1 aminotransferase class I/II-fold pyridoxal phosphate-dependent enzyme [Clostridium thermopalmarium]PRR75955.1 LL-diaminopimelate aminotransferase [Clostridium thermopalmarium DSM 5974]PVZ24532.1 LL-diaminopimelate aminotransferase [Clostridium thermopalmarium DSM 5974]